MLGLTEASLTVTSRLFDNPTSVPPVDRVMSPSLPSEEMEPRVHQ
jgi:hypothetical protein